MPVSVTTFKFEAANKKQTKTKEDFFQTQNKFVSACCLPQKGFAGLGNNSSSSLFFLFFLFLFTFVVMVLLLYIVIVMLCLGLQRLVDIMTFTAYIYQRGIDAFTSCVVVMVNC